MRAVVFHKPRDMRVESVPDPRIEDPRDAIVRVTATAICGSDLHIYNGFLPQPRPMVMGHEFMGIVDEVGSAVTNLKKGDRVIVPFAIACGHCWFCERRKPSNCEHSNPKNYGPEGALLTQKGGGLFGYTDLYGGYPGGQAEAVRVPFADYGPRKVPEELSDEQALFLTDILPTGWSAIDWAEPKGGETVAVFGCGPVGLMAQKIAWLRGAEKVIGVDIEGYRLETAKRTARSETIDAREIDPVERIRELTEGRGADIVVDAVGMEAHRSVLDKINNLVHMRAGSTKVLEQCVSAVRRSGSLSVVGVYGAPADGFPLHQIFDKGLAIRFGQALVHNYVDEILEHVRAKRLDGSDIISHVAKLDEAPRLYKLFNEKQDRCVKVVLKP
jgi:S-(hydroxymethyl)glutathione dehydrogenase/alcohol dehydrogenase